MSEKKWSELHGNAKVTGFISFWLRFSRVISAPFNLLRITPNQISIFAVIISIPLIFNPNQWWLVLIALLLDGIDGQVAISQNRATKFGAVVDSISDRTVEFIWAVALIVLGANAAMTFVFCGCSWVQEYLRARAGGLGFKKIGIITVGERPTRAIFVLMIFLLPNFANSILGIALSVQIISLITLLRVLHREIN
jgi:archaetidylinositol phosphate synthase